ncbi:MAG: hypothetical protein J6C84_05365 [Lachnospiraceae bacterium]|nr:hypothetical protein [Lachnospiraceae bacterium]
MAVTKKTVATAVKPAIAETPAAPVKTEEPAKKETVKKAPVKKEAVKKETVKKAPVKKAAAKKAELKSALHIQFSGKSYAQEDLIKIAKDVWKYDLKQKAADLTSVELYVKPEESVVYYVMNKEFTGSFAI